MKRVNINRVEESITSKLTEISRYESTSGKLVRRTNHGEEQRLSPSIEKEKFVLTRIDEINNKIRKLVSCPSQTAVYSRK